MRRFDGRSLLAIIVFLVAFVGVFFNATSGAGEMSTATATATATSVEAGTTVLPSWLGTILSFDFLFKGLITIGGILIAWVFKLIIQKVGEDKALADAILSIQAGVTSTYNDFVRTAKEVSADGKLTADEKKMARDMAVQKAKEFATGPAKDLLFTWGSKKIEALIEQYLLKAKNAKAAEVAAAPVVTPTSVTTNNAESVK